MFLSSILQQSTYDWRDSNKILPTSWDDNTYTLQKLDEKF